MTASEWFSVSLNAILTLTGAGRINDRVLPYCFYRLYRRWGGPLIMLKTAAMPHAHTPAAIKEYPPFGSWKIPLIFVPVSILALFYHKFTSTSIEIPCIIPN